MRHWPMLLARRAAVVMLAGLATLAGAAEPLERYEFEVLRKGKPMGSHTISVSRVGEDVVAEIDIRLEVSFAFVTLFSYEHHNREVWRDGRLVAIDTRTNSNGDVFSISGRASAAGFVVVDQDGAERTFPADIVPSSYWQARTVDVDALLNTQTGELAQVSVRAAGNDGHYEMRGDIELDLWYAGDCLDRLSFRAPGDGALIAYRPLPQPTRVASTCGAAPSEARALAARGETAS
ncbi:MAG: DUF6134 family protein [Gammaproteobacteria bacterium]